MGSLLYRRVVSSAHGGARRQGLVRADGKAVFDDTGYFHPLGTTWMWAGYAWKFDRQRVVDTVRFLQRYKPDYVRVFGNVDFAGADTDPDWPDYVDMMGGLVDYLYANGIRTHITASGGHARDPEDLTQKLCQVTSVRPGKIICMEAANECLESMSTMKNIARYLLAHANVPLVGLSSPMGNEDELAAAEREVGATIRFRHTDRDPADFGWKQARQGYDCKDIPDVASLDEPPGPEASAGGHQVSPLRLALMRAVGVLDGGAFYTLHTGEGVYGRPDPAHPDRQNDLWAAGSVLGDWTANHPSPVIDAIWRALRAVDALLPAGVENWTKTLGSLHEGPHILNPAFAGWGDGTDGVNRTYGAFQDGQFVQAFLGVRNGADVQFVLPGATECHVTAVNPETGERLTATLHQGEWWHLPGDPNPDANVGWLATGTYR